MEKLIDFRTNLGCLYYRISPRNYSNKIFRWWHDLTEPWVMIYYFTGNGDPHDDMDMLNFSPVFIKSFEYEECITAKTQDELLAKIDKISSPGQERYYKTTKK